MKKFLSLIVLCLLIPIDVFAIEYVVKLSGDDIIPTYDSFGDGQKSMYIDIDNYEEIASATIYIKYDREVLRPVLCGKQNFRAEGCSVTPDEDRDVFFDYRGIDDLKNNHLYYVVFKALENVGEGKNTTVEVWLENAKDKDGNDIIVSSSSKTYTLKYVWPRYNQDSSSDASSEAVNDTIVSNNSSSSNSNNNNNNDNNNSNSNSSAVNNSGITSSNSNNNINIGNDDNDSVDIILDSNELEEVIVDDFSKDELDESKEEKQEEKKNINIDKKYFIIGGVGLSIIIIVGSIIWYKKHKAEEKLFNQI